MFFTRLLRLVHPLGTQSYFIVDNRIVAPPRPTPIAIAHSALALVMSFKTTVSQTNRTSVRRK